MILEKLRAVVELRDKYPGQSAWIVGKGPSLRYLRAEHITDHGPVITMNESIVLVQELGLANPIYSMQKDGCHMQKELRCAAECQMQWPMVNPHPDVTAILQDPGFSENCLPDHPLKLYVEPVRELKLQAATVMSVLMCIKIAMLMGCVKINFVSCDSLKGDFRTIDVKTLKSDTNVFVGHYAYVLPEVREMVKHIPHEIIVPGAP